MEQIKKILETSPPVAFLLESSIIREEKVKLQANAEMISKSLNKILA